MRFWRGRWAVNAAVFVDRKSWKASYGIDAPCIERPRDRSAFVSEQLLKASRDMLEK